MSSDSGRGGLVWSRPEPGARKPSYSRELIVETAIAIADAEGYEAISMRRIASELGAGTMTIYHYVATKDELIALVSDRIMSEMVIPDDELPSGWRDGMAEIARRTLRIFLEHSWVVEHFGEGDPTATGPNVLRHVEQTLEVASRSGLPVEKQFELSATVDDYVFGHAMRLSKTMRPRGDSDEKLRLDAMFAYMIEQLGTGLYPHLSAVMGDDPAAAYKRLAEHTDDDERFERGLQRVLDGIELWVKAEKKAMKKR